MVTLFRKTWQNGNTEPDQIRQYYNACTEYRNQLQDVLEDANMAFQTSLNPIDEKVSVTGGQLIMLTTMLKSIISKREITFGDTQRTSTGEPQHYQQFVDYITTGEHLGSLPLSSRRAAGMGCTLEKNKKGVMEYKPLGAESTYPKKGPLLLSTALMYHRQIIGDPDFTIKNGMPGYTAIANYEADLAQKDNSILGTNQSGNFQQQASNMDIIFNFYLWCEIAEIAKKDKLNLNVFLYLMGQKQMGNAGVLSQLNATSCKIRGILPYMNKTGSIHMPPYAITTSRIYDMVAVFGSVRWDKYESSILSPGISERYITHLKLTSGIAMDFLTRYWNLESASLYGSTGILGSEHCFHQLLINKVSAFENAAGETGNVFAITFIPTAAAKPPSTEADLIGEMLLKKLMPTTEDQEQLNQALTDVDTIGHSIQSQNFISTNKSQIRKELLVNALTMSAIREKMSGFFEPRPLDMRFRNLLQRCQTYGVMAEGSIDFTNDGINEISSAEDLSTIVNMPIHLKQKMLEAKVRKCLVESGRAILAAASSGGDEEKYKNSPLAKLVFDENDPDILIKNQDWLYKAVGPLGIIEDKPYRGSGAVGDEEEEEDEPLDEDQQHDKAEKTQPPDETEDQTIKSTATTPIKPAVKQDNQQSDPEGESLGKIGLDDLKDLGGSNEGDLD